MKKSYWKDATLITSGPSPNLFGESSVSNYFLILSWEKIRPLVSPEHLSGNWWVTKPVPVSYFEQWLSLIIDQVLLLHCSECFTVKLTHTIRSAHLQYLSGVANKSIKVKFTHRQWLDQHALLFDYLLMCYRMSMHFKSNWSTLKRRLVVQKSNIV